MATPRRPVVVGGSGQLGRFLVPFLANSEGCERVLILDMRPPSQEVFDKAGAGKVDFVSHRLGLDNIEDVAEALQKVDCVFSVLTAPLQSASVEDFHSANVRGVQLLLKLAARVHVPRFVHLSSVAVTNMELPCINIREEVPLPPLSGYRSHYDISKRLGEEAVLSADSPGGLRTCTLRACGISLSTRDNMLGTLLSCSLPGMMFVPRTCQRVDMMDGQDLCRALLSAAQTLQERPADVAGQAIYVTKGETMTTRELAEMTASMLGWRLVLIPDRLHDCVLAACHAMHHVRRALGCRLLGCPLHVFWNYHMYEKTFDNTKACERLQFRSKYSMAASVARILAEYKRERRQVLGLELLLQGGCMLGCAATVALSAYRALGGHRP